jgi:hypothetical protein
VESSCELGNEFSGSIKCWELPSGCTSCGLSSGTQLHRVSKLEETPLRKLRHRWEYGIKVGLIERGAVGWIEMTRAAVQWRSFGHRNELKVQNRMHDCAFRRNVTA